MRIEFKPQRLIKHTVLEKNTPTGVKRILDINSKQRKTIEMDLRPKANYPKEYYVSSYNVYGSQGIVLKSMNKTPDGGIVISSRNYDGTYSTKTIK